MYYILRNFSRHFHKKLNYTFHPGQILRLKAWNAEYTQRHVNSTNHNISIINERSRIFIYK